MYALPSSDNLTDIPEFRRQGGRPPGPGRPGVPSRSMLRTSYAELRRLARQLVDAGGTRREIDPHTLVHETARHTLGSSGLQDLADPIGYLAFLANALRRVLVELAEQRPAAEHAWLRPAPLGGRIEVGRLIRALAVLEDRSGRHAQIAVLRLFGGLSDAEIAAELGLTEGRVRAGWARVSDWLRRACSAPRP